MTSFADRILAMNAMYKLPVNVGQLHLPANTAERLRKFKATLSDELDEIDDIILNTTSMHEMPRALLTQLADLLADITVFCRSEALKYGIPLEAVLEIVMDSNESKLGADGQPIYDENGKFLKGPNYWRPEQCIEQLLQGLPLA